MGKTFFTADPHFMHRNITRGCSEWKDKSQLRDFDTCEEMSQAIVDGINKYVGEEDTLVIDGDLAFQGKQNLWEFRKQLVCRDIRVVTGNHDDHLLGNSRITIPEHEYELFRHLTGVVIPRISLLDPLIVGARSLFNRVEKELWMKVGKQLYIIHHWPMRTWYESQHGSILIYGHEHGQIEDEPWGLSLDGGMDNAFRLYGEYRPFDEEMIAEQLKGRTIYKHGHH